MQVTADRRLEVNEGVEVTEAAQQVLDAMQHLLKPKREWVGLTPSEIEAVMRQWDYEADKGGGLKKLVAITEAKLKEKNYD